MSKSTIVPYLYALHICDFDLRASHARKLLPAALTSVSFGFVLVRVRSLSEMDPEESGSEYIFA